METDRTEMHDLAQQYPEKVKELGEMYNEWAAATKVLPWAEILDLYNKK